MKHLLFQDTLLYAIADGNYSQIIYQDGSSELKSKTLGFIGHT